MKKARIKPRVSLRDLQLDDYQISAFLEVLLLSWTKAQWKTVVLTGNQISDITCHFMSHIIEKCKNIEKLDLSNNNISVEGVRLIHESVLRRKAKLILNISKNEKIDRTDTKRYVIACRDLKDVDTIVDLQTEQKATEFDDVTSIEDDLTTFSPNSEMHASPGLDLDTSVDTQDAHQEPSVNSTEIFDSNQSFMEATGSKITDTNQNRSSITTDLPKTPKLQFQSSFLTRQSSTDTSSPNQVQIKIPTSTVDSQTPKSSQKNDLKYDYIISPTVDISSSIHSPLNSPADTNLSAKSPEHEYSTSEITSEINAHSDILKGTNYSSPATPTGRDVQSIKENEGKKSTPNKRGVSSLFSLSRIFRQNHSNKESPSEQKKSINQESNQPSDQLNVSPSIHLLEPNLNQPSPRSQYDSMSSQKVHYAPSTQPQNETKSESRQERKSLNFSPIAPITPVTPSQKRITHFEDVNQGVSTQSNSFISPLLDPIKREDSPTELNAVSRDISELSGVDSMTLQHQAIDDEFPYDIDDTDEDINDVESIINAIQEPDDQSKPISTKEKIIAPTSNKKWIKPDIYVNKKRAENAKIIQEKEAEALEPKPIAKKMLKRIVQDETKKCEYLLNQFSLRIENAQSPEYQYETPEDNRTYKFHSNQKSEDDVNETIKIIPSSIIFVKKDVESSKLSASGSFRSLESSKSENHVYSSFQVKFDNDEQESTSQIYQEETIEDSKNEGYKQENDNSVSLDFKIGSNNEILPIRDSLPSQLTSLSLRGANIESITLTDFLNESDYSSIKILDLSFNRIEKLGTSLKQLHNLQVLNLRGNLLTSLSGVEFLIKLEQLDASVNLIQDSSYLVNLSKLKILDLSYNLIQTLSALRMLSMNKSLQVLNVEGNPTHLRNEQELRVGLSSLLKDQLLIYCHQPSLMATYNSRKKIRDERVQKVLKKKEIPVPTPNTSINLTRRISLQERYQEDSKNKKKLKEAQIRKAGQQDIEEKKRIKDSKSRSYTKSKWQQLNTIPRLETPRYNATDELTQELNSTVKKSASLLDSILEYSSPKIPSLQKSIFSPKYSSQLSNNRTQKLYNSISKDFEEIQSTSIENGYFTSDTWVITEVKEDLNATFMAFSTFKDYVNRKAHFSEFLDLKKLLDDCSLFEPMRVDSIYRSPSIQTYIQKANQAKEKLQTLFESYLQGLESESLNLDDQKMVITLEDAKKQISDDIQNADNQLNENQFNNDNIELKDKLEHEEESNDILKDDINSKISDISKDEESEDYDDEEIIKEEQVEVQSEQNEDNNQSVHVTFDLNNLNDEDNFLLG